MSASRRTVLLVQLPIPPLPGAAGPVRGNVPLAAGYLKLFARIRGLEACYQIDILPTAEANSFGDRALVEAILGREPWMVGFTCYLWNIDRTLWIAGRLKERRPDLRIVLGGPEITADNAWVLKSRDIDYAVIGEGEQTFAELLQSLVSDQAPQRPIDGLFVSKRVGECEGGSALAHPLSHSPTLSLSHTVTPRKPLPDLNAISSPYLAGILDAADEETLLLETIRGCVFKCKFCYYPKSYDGLYFLSEEKILANLRHAEERGAKEVVLLDPTLNQRRDFADFLRVLIRGNPGRQFTFFGELRAEGITPEIAGLLREANFTEVEVGLQSIDPRTQELMDRRNNLRAVERGIHATMEAGIKVKVDLIVGLPGDTVESVRRGMHYLRDYGLYDDVQIFNLAILPGTAFRHEAEPLGLKYQPRPPYYVLETPTLRREEMFALMHEAEEVFDTRWDPLPPPDLSERVREWESGIAVSFHSSHPLTGSWHVDLDSGEARPSIGRRAQAFTLWLRSADFHRDCWRAAGCICKVLTDDPYTTLQVVLEPTGDPARITAGVLRELTSACQRHPTYLDRFYALQPGRPIGAKRIVVLLSAEKSECQSPEWRETVNDFATIAVSDERPSLTAVR